MSARVQDITTAIKTQLEKAGMPHPERHPFTTNYLPRVLHENEHIMAAVFGRRKESEGFFGFVEGILIATDQRVLFIDHRPGYTTTDEVSYDVVSGVSTSSTVFYASITLFTKIANYKLSFANHESVQHFADYIETRVIEHTEVANESVLPIGNQQSFEAVIRNEAMDFLRSHDLGVLSSIQRTGAISGSAVYYTVINDRPHFITKESSRKADNILSNQHVAFTVFDEMKLQTIQIQGIVEQIRDTTDEQFAMTDILRPRTYEDGSHKAPLLRMGTDDITAYRIIPTNYTFTDYGKLRKN